MLEEREEKWYQNRAPVWTQKNEKEAGYMGVFSKYHRFREAGEAANENNVARFGEPDHSLFTTTKVFTLHHHIDIVDAEEQVVYQANTKFPSLHEVVR